RAHGYGVPILFEPLNRFETNVINTVEQALTLLRQLRTQNIKLLCDLFHMNIEEVSIEGALRTAGNSLGHVDFVDSNRLAMGSGHIDPAPVKRALYEIGYNGYLSAEALPVPTPAEAAQRTIATFRQFFR